MGGESVGTAKDHHVLGEVGQFIAHFLVLLILTFFNIRPQLHPGVLPNDIADASGRNGRQVRGPPGKRGGASARGRGKRACACSGLRSLGFLSPQVRGEAPEEVLLPLLQLQGFSALDVADELSLLSLLHLIRAWRGREEKLSWGSGGGRRHDARRAGRKTRRTQGAGLT